jgi:4-hydroxy-2-oxoheptanedioate aldolase
MLPRTETLEQVETAIGALRFAPVGRKGFGGSHQFRTKETFDQFQANRLLILQIESPRGVSSLPDILARYNEQIAGIVIGPYDMSVQVGTPLEIDSAPALEQIRRRWPSAGISACPAESTATTWLSPIAGARPA